VSRVANVYASTSNHSNLSAANVQLTGTASSWMRGVAIETANIVASGGSIGTDATGAVSRVANVYSVLSNSTNFSTANALITGGSITGITGAASTWSVTTGLSAANVQLTGTVSSWMRGVAIETANIVASGGSIGTDAAGAVSRVANVYATLGDFSALNSANAHITSSASTIGTTAAGAVSRIANVYSSLGNYSNFSTANAQITGGTINLAAGNVTAGNIFITDTSIQNYEYNAVTTKSYVDTLMITFGT